MTKDVWPIGPDIHQDVLDRLLDEALEQTFPASDPISLLPDIGCRNAGAQAFRRDEGYKASVAGMQTDRCDPWRNIANSREPDDRKLSGIASDGVLV